MKIAMVTGSYPPNVCGVADYTEQLAHALEDRGVSVEVVSGLDWRAKSAFRVRRFIRDKRVDITHIQYPTVGYGRALGPHTLSVIERGVVTIHEASQTHVLRQLSLYPFLLARHVIFTNGFERDHVRKWAPWIGKTSSIIPIGSNISAGPVVPKRFGNEILYFGLIRPEKGLETVLELAALAKEQGSNKVIRVVGLALKEHQDYLNMLQARAAALPVVWDLGLSHSATAEILVRSAFAYVPFPDGASERRGSLLALLANGVLTVTTRGAQTPAALGRAVLYACSARAALGIFDELLADNAKCKDVSESARRYAQQFSWSIIADRHVSLYEKVAGAKRAA